MPTQPASKTQWIHLETQDGPMECYVARPEGQGPFPGIIVLMEIFGVNPHIRSVTERIAAEGYVAIAPNYYHRTTENLNLSYTAIDVETGRHHKEATTLEGLRMDLRAACQWLGAQPDVEPRNRLGCIGFCFGGHTAFIAAGLPEIAATAAFYPGGIATERPGGGAPTVSLAREIHGEILLLYGNEDPLIPHEDTVTAEKALREAGTRHEVVRYGHAGHGFFCEQRADYVPEIAEDAWRRVKALFSRLSPQKQPVS